MKKWDIRAKFVTRKSKIEIEDVIKVLLENRGVKTGKEKDLFLHPPDPFSLTFTDVDIDKRALEKALTRMRTAIENKESIVVYADYDADGITAGAIMWETLHAMGARVMPYIPRRIEEGYGLSHKGIDAVKAQHDPTLIITVDHGITGWEKVEYARKLGIEVIVTDHHVKPEKLPDCVIVHTTKLAGSGVSWFVSKELSQKRNTEHEALAAIGTIADMVPLVGANRSIAKFGLAAINSTKRIGLLALMQDAGISPGELGTYEISHTIAPRLNAMGRIVHAMDALRLLCTKSEGKAMELARTLGLTNKERQQMTTDTSLHAKDVVVSNGTSAKKLLFISHETYNQGVIGLVAGKLVEEFYLPAIVVSRGEEISKASARSIAGFNIVEAIRSCADILVDVGGHPMAAGFTVETKNLVMLQDRLEQLAEKEISGDMLKRTLRIDCELPAAAISDGLWQQLRVFEPFGFGSPEPVFVSKSFLIEEARLVGADGRHLKLRITNDELPVPLDAIAFGMGELYGKLKTGTPVDIAYAIDMNVWNGKSKLQLKVKDIHVQ